MEVIKVNNEKIKKKYFVKDKLNVVIRIENGGEIEIELLLENEGSEANLYGVVIGDNSNEFKIKTLSHHKAPNTNSRVHLKGVFKDASQLDYEGLIKIDPKAQLADAYLKNDNLVVGDDAVVNSSPQLEIAADDVKASHGVTISTIDEIQEYYLRSRGLNKELSEEMLIEGFINEIKVLELANE